MSNSSSVIAQPNLGPSAAPEVAYHAKLVQALVDIQQGRRSAFSLTPEEQASVVIATHDYVFQADEVLAAVMLRLLPEFARARLIRTREKEQLANAHVLIDVGFVYSAEQLKFDHHQSANIGTFDTDSRVPLSSCGLVWRHYGKRILQHLAADNQVPAFNVDNEAELDRVFRRVYASFIAAVDAADSRFKQYENAGEELFEDNGTLFHRVNRLNPAWNVKATADDRDRAFCAAVTMVKDEFLQAVERIILEWLPASILVHEAYAKREEAHASKMLLEFPSFCPYENHLFALEKSEPAQPKIRCILFSTGRQWQVTCVPVTAGSPQPRTPLPEAWRPKKGATMTLEELRQLSGIPDIIFVHASGFTGACASREGAIKLAESVLLV